MSFTSCACDPNSEVLFGIKSSAMHAVRILSLIMSMMLKGYGTSVYKPI